MAALINMPRAAWRRQPQGSVDICPQFLSKLEVVYNAVTNSDPRSYARKFRTAGLTRYLNSSGVGNGFSGGLGAVRFPEYSDITYEKAFSVFWVASTAAINYRVILGSRSTGPLRAFILADANGQIGAEGTNSNSTYMYKAATPFSMVDGNFHSFCFVKRSSSEHQFYRDGIPVSTTTSVSGDPDNSINSEFEIGGINTGISWYDHQEPINLFALWNRPLLHNEAIALTINPWQLFTPAPSRFYLIPSSGGVITLIVQNASHNHAVESPSLTQAHVLALAESLHGHTVESPLLSQAYALTLAAAAHTHTVDALDLTQAHSLSVAEASHNHSADNVSLFQAHILNLSDALHGHSVEAPTLTVAGSLLIDESYHGQTSESPTLTQAHTITAQDASHGHSGESVSLTQAYVLVPADSTHEHSSEAPTLSTELNLLVADALHSHTVEAPGLTQAHVLSLADSLHGHSAEAVSMGQGYSLIVADASHNHSVESPTVSVAFVLAIQDALHNQAADSLALATHVTLMVSDTLHAHLAGTASEITLPTGDRIFLVAREDRLFLVATEDRLFGV